MSLTIQEVEHIALLARLELSEEEKREYQQQLSDILDHVARLQHLDTSDISPTSRVVLSRSFLREDAPKKGLETEQVLKNSPFTKDNQFKVPPILE